MACRFIQHIPSGCMMTSHLSRDNDILLHTLSKELTMHTCTYPLVLWMFKRQKLKYSFFAFKLNNRFFRRNLRC